MLVYLQVTYNNFYKIFTQQFNISFGDPATDTCSTCERLSSQIKEARRVNNNALRNTQKRELKFHRAKARGFYTHMKREDKQTVSLAFDLQQVLQ